MGEVVQFPELLPPALEDYRSEPAIILILPVVRIDRDEPAPVVRRPGRRSLEVGGLLSPGPEERVRGSFNALDEAFRFARQAEYAQFPALDDLARGTDPGPTGWDGLD